MPGILITLCEITTKYFHFFCYTAQKWSFSLRISSVNVTKSPGIACRLLKQLIWGFLLVLFLSVYLILYTAWKVSVFRVFLVHVFSHLNWIRSISPYLVQMRENKYQKNSEYGHFSRNVNGVLNNLHFP